MFKTRVMSTLNQTDWDALISAIAIGERSVQESAQRADRSVLESARRADRGGEEEDLLRG